VAFESIGGECVFTSEWDAYAQKTYAAKLSLDSFDSVKDAVVKETFFSQLSPQGGNVFAAMPPYTSEYVMMSDAEIEKIKSWIKQGFQK
jgi:site-specific DNA-cytosine methylase